MNNAIIPHTGMVHGGAWKRRVEKLLSVHHEQYGSRLDAIIERQIENAMTGSIASARFLFDIMKTPDISEENNKKHVIEGFNLNDYVIEPDEVQESKGIETKTETQANGQED